MESNSSQQILFSHIKGLIPPNLTLVDVIAEVLNISNDSAYRRIRGEKPIPLDEVRVLATHFKLSVDQLLNLESNVFIFTGSFTNNTDFKYHNWLESVATHLQYFLSFHPNHLFYLAKEVPFYYYFLFPEIAAFKSFFFMKSILSYEDWKTVKFSVSDDYSQFHELMQKCSKLFTALPSTEIWNIENITSTLHQIEFYRVTGALKSNEDALVLFEKFDLLIDHLEIQAEYGVKLQLGQNPSTGKAALKLYINELIWGDNMQLIQFGNKQITVINHCVLNFITTMDESFNTYTKKTVDKLTQKSTLISEVNEKERMLFFNKLRAKVNAAKQLAVNE
jgi:BetR domain